jgi:hypothetical protein
MPRRKQAPARLIRVIVLDEGRTRGRLVEVRARQTIRQFKLANFARHGTPDQIHLVWRRHTITEREGASPATPMLEQFAIGEGDVLHAMVVLQCED